MKGEEKMMDTKLIQAFNKQINYEFYSAYLYFAMSTYFDEIAMMGFGSYMRHKASEKLNNAHKIYDYLILRDEKLIFSKIEEPDTDWINVSDVFSAALSHEEFISTQTDELFKTAQETQDIASMEFISDLIKNQVESVGKIRKLVFRIKNSNVVSTSIELLNSEISNVK